MYVQFTSCVYWVVLKIIKFFVLMLVKKTKVLCCPWVSNRHWTPNKHKIRIKPWYFQIHQNWIIFLQVYVTHFEYWLFLKLSNLTAHQNKSRPDREICRTWHESEEKISFFRVSKKTTGKLFSYEQPLKGTVMQII